MIKVIGNYPEGWEHPVILHGPLTIGQYVHLAGRRYFVTGNLVQGYKLDRPLETRLGHGAIGEAGGKVEFAFHRFFGDPIGVSDDSSN